jgi:hypothetical protein
MKKRPKCPNEPDGVHFYRIGEDQCAYCGLDYGYPEYYRDPVKGLEELHRMARDKEHEGEQRTGEREAPELGDLGVGGVAVGERAENQDENRDESGHRSTVPKKRPAGGLDGLPHRGTEKTGLPPTGPAILWWATLNHKGKKG